MKSFLATLFAVFLAASTVHTAPALSSDADQFQQAAVEEMIARRDDGLSISCDACQGRLDDCLKYGFQISENIEHCENICYAFMCRKYPVCHACNPKFGFCDPRHQVHL